MFEINDQLSKQKLHEKKKYNEWTNNKNQPAH